MWIAQAAERRTPLTIACPESNPDPFMSRTIVIDVGKNFAASALGTLRAAVAVVENSGD